MQPLFVTSLLKSCPYLLACKSPSPGFEFLPHNPASLLLRQNCFLYWRPAQTLHHLRCCVLAETDLDFHLCLHASPIKEPLALAEARSCPPSLRSFTLQSENLTAQIFAVHLFLKVTLVLSDSQLARAPTRQFNGVENSYALSKVFDYHQLQEID